MRRLEVLRKEADLTQAELGAKAKMTQSRISMIESGVYTPPPGGKELPRLAEVFGIDPEHGLMLLDEVEPEVQPEKKTE